MYTTPKVELSWSRWVASTPSVIHSFVVLSSTVIHQYNKHQTSLICYLSIGKDDKEYAVKIFKTSILVFKDRDKYVSGEWTLMLLYMNYSIIIIIYKILHIDCLTYIIQSVTGDDVMRGWSILVDNLCCSYCYLLMWWLLLLLCFQVSIGFVMDTVNPTLGRWWARYTTLYELLCRTMSIYLYSSLY